MSKHETLEQIAERLAAAIDDLPGYHFRSTVVSLILKALLEAEKRGEQRAAKLGGALLDSAIERVEKAEAEVERLRELVTKLQVEANEQARNRIKELR